jgi:hypothetical protein
MCVNIQVTHGEWECLSLNQSTWERRQVEIRSKVVKACHMLKYSYHLSSRHLLTWGVLLLETHMRRRDRADQKQVRRTQGPRRQVPVP